MPSHQNNRFSNLNNNVSEHELIRTRVSNTTSGNGFSTNKNSAKSNDIDLNLNNNKEYVPPIKVQNKRISEIRSQIATIKNIKITPNMFRATQFGNYIYPQTVCDYKVIKKYCDDNGYKYITHPLNEEMITKFCLYGLEQMSHDVLENEMDRFGTKPIEITEIPIRGKRYQEQCIYVLHFMKKQNVRLESLQQITGLFHTRIKFAAYDNPNKGQPVQCKRCQSFNHGDKGCTLDYKCRRCGGSHSSYDCVHLPDLEDSEMLEELGDTVQKPKKDHMQKIDTKFVKCANCGGNHTANYKGCEVRQRIVELRESIRKKNTIIGKQVPPNINDQHTFQRLPPTQTPIGNNSWQQTSTSSYARPSSTHQHRNFTAYQQPRQYQTNDPYYQQEPCDLFDPDECSMIMDEFMSRLSTCRCKQDQIKIIGQLTFKFLWSPNGYTK